ncbi:MAG: MarR family transcriptional regulator [Armatimonas sp.]
MDSSEEKKLTVAKLSKGSMRLDNQLCFPLYATSRRMTKLYSFFLDPIGLTYPQYLVLLVLWERDPRTVTEICAELQLNTNTLTPLLKRLEQMELVWRQRHEGDERVVEIHLTEAGKAKREECQEVPNQMGEAIQLDWDSANQLRELIDDLNLKLTNAISRQENTEP